MFHWILKHYPKQTQRALEILPGFVSINIIIFPYWGIFFIPYVVAYFVLFFDIYWFYQSLTTTITSSISHLRMTEAEKFDWTKACIKLSGWDKVEQLIIIPTYKEPLTTLRRTFKTLESQDLPHKKLHVVLAMEKKEDETARTEKVKALKKEFGKMFGSLLVTVHTLVPGEVAGKSANELYGTLQAREEIIKKKKLDPKFVIVTSCDADHVYHPKHFSCLAYKFLSDPDRYNKFWQPAVLFYQNIWKLPPPTRVVNRMASIWNLAQLPRRDRLVNNQNYSLSFYLLDKAGYWDPDIIPEDYHIFFKAFFKTNGKVSVEAIYLPLFADAPEGETLFKAMKAQYFQYQRWAWGVSDDPYVIKNYLLSDMPFWTKTLRLMNLVREHFFWPVNWFIVTLGISIPVLLNPTFARTVIGYTLPGISALILSLALSFIIIMLIIESHHKPPAPKGYALWKKILSPLEFILLPFVGFLLGALPGLDAHIRLMFGKYLEYRVTEKV